MIDMLYVWFHKALLPLSSGAGSTLCTIRLIEYPLFDHITLKARISQQVLLALVLAVAVLGVHFQNQILHPSCVALWKPVASPWPEKWLWPPQSATSASQGWARRRGIQWGPCRVVTNYRRVWSALSTEESSKCNQMRWKREKSGIWDYKNVGMVIKPDSKPHWMNTLVYFSLS